jgi:molybdate transport system ATP-binding protein
VTAGLLEARFVKRFRRGRGRGGDAAVRIHGQLEQEVDRFNVTVLFGPSGCGKTTVLRCLAGLERPEEGRIRFDGRDWLDAQGRAFIPPQRRDVGMLFQDFALFGHMSVERNIAYPLVRLPREQRRRRTAELIDRLGLVGLEHNLPRQVSGGQQQRVALARAVARRPRLLLLDEPLSALDSPTRSGLRRELRSVLESLGIPVVLVTHDVMEAVALADRVVVMDGGRVLQSGPIGEVFTRPAGPRVAEIVGVESVVAGELESVEGGVGRVRVGTAGGGTPGTTLHAVTDLSPGPVHVCIRAENVVLELDEPPAHGAHAPQGRDRWHGTSARNHLRATIKAVTPEGPVFRVELDAGFTLHAVVTAQSRERMGLREGLSVTAVVKAPSVHLARRRVSP